MKLGMLLAAWAALCGGMGWVYLHTPPRPINRRTHRLGRMLSISPALRRVA